MKSIFSQISKFSLLNHAKRLAMAVVFLSFAAIATAGGGDGNTWNAKYYLQVHRHSLSTGSGTVYFEATDGDQYNGNSTNAEGDRVTFAANYNLSQSNPSGWSHVYNDDIDEGTTSVTMGGKFTIISDDGSYFDGWYKPEETKLQADGTMNVSVTAVKESSEKITEHYYAKFTAKTYRAKSPEVGVYFKDSEGNYTENAGGTVAVTWDGNTTPNYATSVASTDADKQGNGVDDEATITFSYHVQETSGFHFVGWATSIDDQDYATRTDNPMQVSVETTWSTNDVN